jgi:hypothetical protein
MEHRKSDTSYGRYRWLLVPGTYTLEASKEGYYSDTTFNITVSPDTSTVVDIALSPLMIGDVNIDRDINLSDVIFIANYYFKSGPTPDPLYLADVNCDTGVDVSDIIYLANYILKGGPEPCAH